MLAASEGHLEIIRLLITAGADINHEDHVRVDLFYSHVVVGQFARKETDLLHVMAQFSFEIEDGSGFIFEQVGQTGAPRAKNV